jgi:hypothetical protein
LPGAGDVFDSKLIKSPELTLGTRINVNKNINERKCPNGIQIGCKVICNKSTKLSNGQKILNGMIGIVKGINDGKYDILFENNELINGIFRNYLDLAYGVTVYKYQGKSVDYNFNCILSNERGLISLEELYTMFSRSTKLEYIHIDFKKYKGLIFKSVFNNDHICKENPVNECKKGYIYSISDKDYIYIGQSTREINKDGLLERFNEHLRDNKDVKNMVNPEFKILFSCLRKNLNKLERFVIKSVGLNDSRKLLNVQHNSGKELMTTPMNEKTEIIISGMNEIANNNNIKGITKYKYGWRVKKVIDGKRHMKKFKEYSEAVSFIESLLK